MFAWRSRGACHGHGNDWWFSDDPLDTALARTVCASCPVLTACADHGRREPAGMWGGRTRAQRDAAGLSLPPIDYCGFCRTPLPDGHTGAMHEHCQRAMVAAMRKQTRASISAGRVCERCDVALWPQARSCLICGHIVGDDLPEREWK